MPNMVISRGNGSVERAIRGTGHAECVCTEKVHVYGWCCSFFFFIVALCPRKRDVLLGTGTEWEGDDRVKARPRKPPEKDRRDHGPPPEQ